MFLFLYDVQNFPFYEPLSKDLQSKNLKSNDLKSKDLESKDLKSKDPYV